MTKKLKKGRHPPATVAVQFHIRLKLAKGKTKGIRREDLYEKHLYFLCEYFTDLKKKDYLRDVDFILYPAL